MAHGSGRENATRPEGIGDTLPAPLAVVDMIMNVAQRHDRAPTFLDDKHEARNWTFAEIVDGPSAMRLIWGRTVSCPANAWH